MYSNVKIFIVTFLFLAASCGKDKTPAPPPVVPPIVTDNTTLKEMASYTTGVAISYDLMKNNSSYAALVKKEFDRVTFEYQMKHGANVLNNGSFDFSRADASPHRPCSSEHLLALYVGPVLVRADWLDADVFLRDVLCSARTLPGDRAAGRGRCHGGGQVAPVGDALQPFFLCLGGGVLSGDDAAGADSRRTKVLCDGGWAGFDRLRAGVPVEPDDSKQPGNIGLGGRAAGSRVRHWQHQRYAAVQPQLVRLR